MHSQKFERGMAVGAYASRHHMISAVVAVLIAGPVLVLPSAAFGVILDANSFVAVRHLAKPDNPLAEGQSYSAGGITGTGDVFGMADSVRGHAIQGCLGSSGGHCEDPVVWKRAENYEGRIVFGGLPYFTRAFAFNAPPELEGDFNSGEITDAIRQEWSNQGLTLADDAQLSIESTKEGARWIVHEPATPEGCRNTGQVCRENDYQIFKRGDELQVEDHSPTKPHGVHVGTNGGKVSEGGYAAGQWNVDNFSTFFYDINNDVFVDHAGGWGQDVNNHRIVLSTYDNYSEMPPAFVASPDAVSEDEPRGWIHTFDDQLFLTAINDNNILVGTFNDNPIRIMPTGTVAGGEHSFPTYDQFNPQTDVMAELGLPFTASRAVDISSNETPYIAGVSFDFSQFGNAGVIWNLEGEIIQNLGPNRTPRGITEDGTIVFGNIVDIVGGTSSPALWMTDDGWENFTELVLQDLLADLKNGDVPGATAIERFEGSIGETCCFIAGVNGSGQVLVQAIPDPLAPSVLRPATGAVYLLDTLPLDTGVIKGDVNNDSIVDFLDITPFINAQSAEGDEEAFLLLTPNGCFLCADIDMDGAIDFLDITPFVNLLDEAAAAVPEPASAALLIIGLVTMRRRTR